MKERNSNQAERAKNGNESGAEMQVHVRTITGESATVRISANETVEHLKQLLCQSFPSVTANSNFHIFFKGSKLKPQSQIVRYNIQSSDFLVLVPYVKKEPSHTQKSHNAEHSAKTVTGSIVADKPSITAFADSVWSEIMQDISYISQGGTSNNDDQDHTPTASRIGTFNAEVTDAVNVDNTCTPSSSLGRDASLNTVSSKKGLPYQLILNNLRYPSDDVLSDWNCRVIVKVLEAVSCLSDMNHGYCKPFQKACLRTDGIECCENNGGSCLCPGWLKRFMKAFAFLNIFSALLYLQRKPTTLSVLEEAMNQLEKFDVKLGIEDIKHLSLVCPKLICFQDNHNEDTTFGDILLIFDSTRKQNVEVEDTHKTGRRLMYQSKIVSTLKRRESSFRTNLWNPFERLLSTIGSGTSMETPLEDFLSSLEQYGPSENENSRAKRARSNPTALKSDSYHGSCHDMKSLSAVEMVKHLQERVGYKGQIVHVQDICAREAVLLEIPFDLSENMRSALNRVGISKLYSHQVESIQASFSGKDVVVATMTSSGKSLCYNLPVIEELCQNMLSCALYIFPTKALAQDQQRAMFSMTKGFDISLNMGIYDGDTSHKDRTWLRNNARLLITNPDMLHISILPHHQKFSRILSNLRFVVIDETHTYTGAFGCHTALILRRLRRLCSHVYGSDPRFVFSTATSANPREHCMELANLSTLELIHNDGSPSARKLFVLWNPRDDSSIKHTSPIMEVSRLFAEMVQHGLRCITFCKSRKLCELVLSYTREILHKTAPHLVNLISAYRGGYMAEERRKIEGNLFGGILHGIAATNALELGIDVGEIDVTLHLGFPGSIASLWQQAGRAGRRDKPSLAVYVAFEGPLDQYFMNYPEKLFGRPIECCHLDAQNKQVLEQQLVCAAQEYPLSLQYDEMYFGSSLSDALMSLKSRGYLVSNPFSDSSIWNYIGKEKLPSHSINIRAMEAISYEVIDQQTEEVLEEIEESKAFFQVYEGAVYMRQGKSYLVERLDLSNKRAHCKEADLKYYTKTRDYTDIHVIGGNLAYPVKISSKEFAEVNALANMCKVTTTWFGFYRIRRGSNEIFDTVELSLPQYSYESQAVWVPVAPSIKSAVIKLGFDFRGGLHAASHAILNVVPLHIICNLSDLAPECPNPNDTRYLPERILLYDQRPGGAGLSVQVQPIFAKLLMAAIDLLASCHCSKDVGCPNCIQSFACHEYNEVLHKDGAIMIMKGVLDAES